ncbi:hypothetical protein D3C87_920440 [compost metagenome]
MNQDCNERYRKLPFELQRSLKNVYSRQARRGEPSPKDLLEIYDSLSWWNLFNSHWFDTLKCYTPSGNETISLDTFLKDSEGVRVVTGTMGNKNVVVKSINSKKHSIRSEMSYYLHLKEVGCPTPWFSTDFYFWGEPVLVIELLSPLDAYDDEIQLGLQIIDQLKFVHQFGCHSDIKPQNIMKKVTRDKKTGKRMKQYFLIDFGGVADEEMEEGYRRWIWTRKWTSQEPHSADRIITCTNDFVELAYVMRAIQIWRSKPVRKTPKDGSKDGDFRKIKDYSGRLLSFMKAVCDHEITDHKTLQSILRGKKHVK